MNLVKKTTLENLDFLLSLDAAKKNLSHALNEIIYPNYMDESLNKPIINVLKDTLDHVSRIEELTANGDIDILRPNPIKEDFVDDCQNRRDYGSVKNF